MFVSKRLIYFLCITIFFIPSVVHYAFYKSLFRKTGMKNSISEHRNFSVHRHTEYNCKNITKSVLSEIENATGFNDWCAKYQRKNLSYTFYSDKHSVKDYVTKTVPNLKIAEEYNFVSRADDIDDALISTLPTSYIFKASHLLGGVAFVQNNEIKCVRSPCPKRNSLNNLHYLRLLCKTWLKVNYGKITHELFYQGIEPKCMFEETIANITTIIDYKVFTFHGKPYFIETDVDRFIKHQRDFYTPKWVRMPITKKPSYLAYDKPEVMSKPNFLEEMLKVTKNLAKPFIMMRVDFFIFGDKFVFSELTPTHQNCLGHFDPIVIEKLYGYIVEKAVHMDPEIVTCLL